MTIKPWTERTEFNGPCYPPEAQQEIDELRAKSEMDDVMLAGNTVLINELREKLAELSEQEPVAWMNTSGTLAWSQHDLDSFDDESRCKYPVPLYLAAGAKE